MKSSARAATDWLLGAVGCINDFDNGERHSGILTIHVGVSHSGSKYVEDSLSSSLGRVDLEGIGMPFLWKMSNSCSRAFSALRLGRSVSNAELSAGIKSIS